MPLYAPSERNPPPLRWTPRRDPYLRQDEIEYTRGLTQRLTPVGVCHCGNSGLLFPEYGPGARGTRKLLGFHCLICRCDEHTPAAHALWSDAQRSGKGTSSASTQHPGCGRRCERGALDGLLAEDFPTFEKWVRTNGQAALRKAAREHNS